MVKWSLAILTVLCATVFVIAGNEKEPVPQTAANGNVRTHYFKQKLDHFDENNNKTWQMPFYYNSEHGMPAGPVIIFFQNCVLPETIAGGPLYDMAKEYKAYLFAVGIRFYCDNRPVDAMTDENIRYLNPYQIIYDLDRFATAMKAHYGNTNIILVSGGYAARFVSRLKKWSPNVVDAGWASCAPLEAKADFYEFLEIIGQSIKKMHGEKYYHRIQRGIAELESMFDNNRGQEVKKILPLCDSFNADNDKDISTLFYGIARFFSTEVLRQRENGRKGYCRKCNGALDESNTDIDVIKDLLHCLNKIFGTECQDFSYNSFLTTIKDASFDMPEDLSNYSTISKIMSGVNQNILRPYFYERCNELGYFPTTTSSNQPFGTKNPLTFFTTLCADAFGDEYSYNYIQRKIADTNYLFDGRKPDVENIYFTYGELDPYKAVGVEDGRQVAIPNCGLCADIYNDCNTSQIQALRRNVYDVIRKWIKG